MGNMSSSSAWELSSSGGLGAYYMYGNPRSDRLLYMRDMFSRNSRSRQRRRTSNQRQRRSIEEDSNTEKHIPARFYLEESTFLKLIQNEVVAPRLKGSDTKKDGYRLECPICFYYYPALNFTVCCKQCICSACFFRIQRKRRETSAPCSFCKAPLFEIVYDPNAQDDIEQSQMSESKDKETGDISETSDESIVRCEHGKNTCKKRDKLSSTAVVSKQVNQDNDDVPFNPREVEIPSFLQDEGYTYDDLVLMEAYFRSMRSARV
eukprot:jgi/Galph1/1586/GphlegSOOS_G263.1